MTVPQVGCGPTWVIDGPPPRPREYTLLSASRVIDDVDDGTVERWLNGAKVYPYAPETPSAWDPTLGSGSTQGEKDEGGARALPQFGALVVYQPDSCTMAGIMGGGITPEEAQARFVDRAKLVLAATEAFAVEHEFMNGTLLGANPHLADGDATELNGGSATSILNAFALLENAIGETGRDGVIHCTPAAALVASGKHVIWRDERGPGGMPVLRTINGTIVIPGAGYVGAQNPPHLPVAGGTKEWIYATGPIEIRRSAPFTNPENVSEALDREDNTIVYRVERYYLADWDVTLQAAVLADRCQTTC